MAISQVDIMRMNEFLQGKVESFYDVIPASTKMDINELFEILIKLFRKGLQIGRKDLYLYNILIAMDSIIDELDENGDGLDMELGDEARKLKKEYLEYAEKKGRVNEDILKKVTLISQYIYIGDSVYGNEEDIEEEVIEKSEEEQRKEIIDKITSSVTSLNQENETLRQEIEALKRERRSLQKSVESKNRQLKKANTELSALRLDKKGHDKKVDTLNKKVSELNNTVSEQSSKIAESEKSENLYGSQARELAKLREELDIFHKKEKILASKPNKDNAYDKVKRAIIDILIKKKASFEEIELELIRRKVFLERPLLFSLLQELTQEYSIQTTIRNNGVLAYNIVTPNIDTNNHIIIPCAKKRYFNIALTGDWHLYSLDNNSDFKIIDALNDYCAKYGINVILNMGDLTDYDFSSISVDNLSELSKDAYKRIERLANMLPFDINISHYVLGGNHDEQMRRLKLDVLRIISEIRPDIFSLGYNHAFVQLNKSILGLHHPNRKCDTLRQYLSYLMTYYKCNCPNYNYEDIYMDIFGHFHCFNFFEEEGFLSVPALTRDSRGAIHLRVYIDEVGNIDSMEIIPLKYHKNKGLKREKTLEYCRKEESRKGNK